MKFRWPWIVLPVGLGAAAGLVLHFSTITDPLIYVQAKLSLLVFGLSILISLALGGMYLREKRDQDIVKIAEKEFSEDRRRFLQRLDQELKNPLTAVLAGLACDRLEQARMAQICVTDTVPIRNDVRGRLPGLVVLSVAELMGEAILRIHQHASISALFE